MLKAFSIIYLFVVHAMLAAALLWTDAVAKITTLAGLTEPGVAAIERTNKQLSDRRDPSIAPGVAIFLGDSITHGLAVSRIEPRAENFGISGQTTTQLINAIPNYRSISSASRIYLMIGINDIANGRSNMLPERFETIASLMPKDVPLIWSGIMPMAGNLKAIESANKAIELSCYKLSRCSYIDTFSAMAGKSGDPLDGYTLDGIHPSKLGYQVWISQLTKARSAR